jgi:hypothetical protein
LRAELFSVELMQIFKLMLTRTELVFRKIKRIFNDSKRFK